MSEHVSQGGAVTSNANFGTPIACYSMLRQKARLLCDRGWSPILRRKARNVARCATGCLGLWFLLCIFVVLILIRRQTQRRLNDETSGRRKPRGRDTNNTTIIDSSFMDTIYRTCIFSNIILIIGENGISFPEVMGCMVGVFGVEHLSFFSILSLL